MQPRMGLTLVVLVLLPAEPGRADEGYPPWLTRQPSAWNTIWDEPSANMAPSPPRGMSSGGQVVQSGYQVPSSSSAGCAPQLVPQPAPGACRVCVSRECPPHVCPPHAQAQGAPDAQPQGPPGMFAAPQGRGEISGESSSLGIRGFAIRIPAIQLELPTIQLPSLIRFRREPEMRMEAAYAPYVTGVPAVYGQLAPGGIAQVAPAPVPPPAYPQSQMLPPPKEPCPQPCATSAYSMTGQEESLRHELAERERVIRELESKLQKLQALEQSLNQLSQQHQQLMQEIRPACPPAAGKAESPYAPAPTNPPFAPPALEESTEDRLKLFD